MAKVTKRMLSPQIWLKPELGEMPMGCRLFYIGLISIADDEGRLIHNNRLLKAAIFPYDLDDAVPIAEWLTLLLDAELLVTWADDEKTYLAHPKWHQYQYLRGDRYTPSGLPEPPKGLGVMRRGGKPSANGKAEAKPKAKAEKKPQTWPQEAHEILRGWQAVRPPNEGVSNDEALSAITQMHTIDKKSWEFIDQVCTYLLNNWTKRMIGSLSKLRKTNKNGQQPDLMCWQIVENQMAPADDEGLDALVGQL